MKTASTGTDLRGIDSASSHGTSALDAKAGRFLFERGRLAEREAIAPAAVLPEQFHSSPRQHYHGRGEVALMQAVLEDAIECFQKQFGTPRFRDYRIAREAEQWFFTDDYQWPFSFVNICSVLGIDPDYIRRGLNKQKAERPVEIPRRALHHPIIVRPQLKEAA